RGDRGRPATGPVRCRDADRLGVAAARTPGALTSPAMDPRRAIVPALHTLIASGVGILAIIGLFGAESAGQPAIGLDNSRFALLIIVPLIGIVMLGLFDWQLGRGTGILRAADLAVFALATLELSLGTTGFVRWLAGGLAVLAAAGLAASILISAPHRAGFR